MSYHTQDESFKPIAIHCRVAGKVTEQSYLGSSGPSFWSSNQRAIYLLYVDDALNPSDRSRDRMSAMPDMYVPYIEEGDLVLEWGENVPGGKHWIADPSEVSFFFSVEDVAAMKALGLCQRCGSKGDWINLVPICEYHGRIL